MYTEDGWGGGRGGGGSLCVLVAACLFAVGLLLFFNLRIIQISYCDQRPSHIDFSVSKAILLSGIQGVPVTKIKNP